MKGVTTGTLYRAMLLSLVIVLCLSLAPLNVEWLYMRPEFLALWLIFWALYYPDKFGVLMAFWIGLLWDLGSGNVLGIYGLSSAVVVYVGRAWGRNIVFLDTVQKTVFVALLILTFMMIRLGMGVLWDNITWVQLPNYLITVAMSLAAWPIMLAALQRWQHNDVG